MREDKNLLLSSKANNFLVHNVIHELRGVAGEIRIVKEISLMDSKQAGNKQKIPEDA